MQHSHYNMYSTERCPRAHIYRRFAVGTEFHILPIQHIFALTSTRLFQLQPPFSTTIFSCSHRLCCFQPARGEAWRDCSSSSSSHRIKRESDRTANKNDLNIPSSHTPQTHTRSHKQTHEHTDTFAGGLLALVFQFNAKLFISIENYLAW